MKKMLRGAMVVVLALMQWTLQAQTTCEVKIVGMDVYGDGWDYGRLAVVQAGDTVATFTIPMQSNEAWVPIWDSTTVELQNGVPVSFVWTEATANEDVVIWIYDGGGALVYSAAEPAGGVLYEMASPCPSCMPPTGLTAAVTGQEVTLAWSAIAGTEWQVVWGPVGMDPDTVVVNRTTAPGMSSIVGNLEDGVYRAYVRSLCGAGDSSYWAGVTFSVGVEMVEMAATGVDTLRSCRAAIFDNGGAAGSYGNNCDATLVLLPGDESQVLKISGWSQTEGGYDYLTIYEGEGTTGEVLFSDSTATDENVREFGPFIGAAFTVRFHSNYIYSLEGFRIDMECQAPMACARPEAFAVTDVTDSSVAFSWSDDANYFWTIAYGPAGFTPGDEETRYEDFPNVGGVVDSLEADRDYDFYLMAICGYTEGDSSMTRMVSAHTACAMDNSGLPIVYNFDNDTVATSSVAGFIGCWTRIQGDEATSYYPYVSGSWNHSADGSKSLYWANTNANNGQTLVLPAIDIEEYPISGLRLKFWTRATGASYHPVFQVGVMTNPNDISTFSEVATVNVSGTTWAEHEVQLGSYEGSGRYVALRSIYSGTNWYAYIDDISIDAIPSCATPAGLVVDSTSTEEIYLHWTGLSGEDNWLVTLDGNLLPDATDNHYVVSGLMPNTAYTISVAALCYNGDTSEAVSLRTYTACGEVNAMPLVEDFEGYSTGSTGTFHPCWGKGNNTGNNYPYIETYSGNKVMYFYSYNTNKYGYIVMPAIGESIDINELEMTFKIRKRSSNSNHHADVVVGMIDGTVYNDAVEMDVLGSFSATSGEWVEAYVDLANYQGTKRNIVFVGRTNAASTYNYLHLDSIDLHMHSGCLRPGGLTLVTATDTSATYEWSGEAAGYEYVVESDSGTVVASGMVQDSSNTFTATGLTLGDDYTVRVRTICGAGDTSQWQVVDLHLGYCTPNPTSVGGNGIVNVSFGTGSEVVDNSQGPMGAPFYGDYSTMAGAVAAGSDAEVDVTYATGSPYGTIIWVDWNRDFLFDGSEVVYVGESYATNPTTLHCSFPIAATQDTGRYRMRIAGAFVYFDNYIESIAAAAAVSPCFSAASAVVHDYTLHVVEAPSCLRPQNLTVTGVGTTTATVSWTPMNGETAWEVSVGNGAPIVTQSNPHTLSGLASGTNYSVSVRAICGEGDTSFAGTVSFATQCTDVQVPITYDFEQYADMQPVNCWTIAAGSSYISLADQHIYNVPAVLHGANYAHDGTAALLFYPQNSRPDIIATQTVDHAGNDLYVSFWTKGYMYGTTGGFEAGVMTDATDPSTFVSLYSLGADDTLMAEHEFVTSSLASDAHVSVAFRATTGQSYAFIPIDDVTIEAIPTCGRPGALTVSNITATTAELTWVANAEAPAYQVAYVADGDTTLLPDTLSGTTATLTGLTEGMTYKALVRSYCSAADQSPWRWVTFSTACLDVTEYPYHEGFEHELTCWVPMDVDNAGNGWQTGSVTGVDAHGGSGYAVSYSSNMVNYHADEWLFSPRFVLPQADEVTFSWYARVNGSHPADRYDVLISTTTLDTGNFAVLTDITPTNADGNWVLHTLDLSSYAGMPVYMAFHHHDSYGQGYLLIDDIAIAVDGLAPCPTPVVASHSETGNTVTVSFSAPGTVEVAIAETWDGTAEAVVAEGNSHTFSGLDPGTAYTVGLRSLCSGDMVSDWILLQVNTIDILCLAPTEVEIEATTHDGAVVSWTAGGEETEWVVMVSSSTLSREYTVSGTPSYTITGLYSDMSYTVSVRAHCGGSSYSQWTAPIPFATVVCEPVTGVTAVAEGAAIRVSWHGTGASRYLVSYFLADFTTGGDSVEVSNSTSTMLTGLASGETYDVYVQAYCAENVLSQASEKVTVTMTGIDAVDGSSVVIYPNPASSRVTLRGIEGTATVTMVDLNGRECGTWSSTDGNLAIDLTGYAAGTYFIRVVNERAVAIRKLIVE